MPLPLAPVVAGALIGGLVQAASSLVGRVLLALGIGYVSYTGLDTALGWLKTEALARLSATPADFLGIVSVLQVGTAFNILFSAFLARLVISGLTSGAVKRMVLK